MLDSETLSSWDLDTLVEYLYDSFVSFVVQMITYKNQFDKSVSKYFDPSEIILLTVILVAIWQILYDKYTEIRQIGLKAYLFEKITKLPIISGLVEKEQDKVKKGMISGFKKNRKITYSELPEKGMSTTAIMK